MDSIIFPVTSKHKLHTHIDDMDKNISTLGNMTSVAKVILLKKQNKATTQVGVAVFCCLKTPSILHLKALTPVFDCKNGDGGVAYTKGVSRQKPSTFTTYFGSGGIACQSSCLVKFSRQSSPPTHS